MKESNEKNLKTICLGGGCFWCIEAIFEGVIGVQNVTSGFSGGKIKNPSYSSLRVVVLSQPIPYHYYHPLENRLEIFLSLNSHVSGPRTPFLTWCLPS